MAEQAPKPAPQRQTESTPMMSSRQTMRALAAAVIGAALLVVSGLTLTTTVICLVVATPLLVIFSPVLVPGGLVMFFATTGFLFAGVFAVAALSALSWIYEYVTGRHPPGSDQLDYARTKMANKAKEMRERAKEYGQYVQNMTQEAATANQGTVPSKTKEAAPANQGTVPSKTEAAPANQGAVPSKTKEAAPANQGTTTGQASK
ncbi:hypothetical protein Sjap_019517 [Stephania japonica]|uniref:Oleosin n=1 Tax=Stephania japonica TaxID=461633 RepID=A0AAP0F673_9MAGN